MNQVMVAQKKDVPLKRRQWLKDKHVQISFAKKHKVVFISYHKLLSRLCRYNNVLYVLDLFMLISLLNYLGSDVSSTDGNIYCLCV